LMIIAMFDPVSTGADDADGIVVKQ
jgi:hypothetical protein